MQKKIRSLMVDDERVAREILETHLSKIEAVEIAGSCQIAVEAFNILSRQKIDLIFSIKSIHSPANWWKSGKSKFPLAGVIKKGYWRNWNKIE